MVNAALAGAGGLYVATGSLVVVLLGCCLAALVVALAAGSDRGR